MPVDDFYKDWAEAQFGKNVAPEMAAIFISIDGGPLYTRGKDAVRTANVFRSADWTGKGPGGVKPNIKPWEEAKANFIYIDKLSKIRDQVKGAGNKQRFDYWYQFLSYNRDMAEIGCIFGQMDTLMKLVNVEKNEDMKRKMAEEKVLPLKVKAEQKWSGMMTRLLEIVNTPGEMGTIANLEEHNLGHMQALSKYDSALSVVLHKPITTSLSKDYKGASRLVVPTKRTLLETNEDLDIKVMVLSAKATKSVDIYWRKFGRPRIQKRPA